MEKRNVALTIFEKASAAFDIPGDVVGGMPRVTVTTGKINVENHRGLLAYDTEGITLNTVSGTVKIIGNEIELTAMTDTELAAKGIIRSVEFGG